MQKLSVILLFLFLLLPISWAGIGDDPKWQEYVVGKVTDLPHGPIKNFLLASHFNNPYGETIKKQTSALGPFAPQADNIFWIPSIDVPATGENWRLLSSLQGLPDTILKTVVVGENEKGVPLVRMFVHPFTLDEPEFQKIAQENGGFKFKFQGATTASVRSLIAWEVPEEKPAGKAGALMYPKSQEGFIWPKVSIYKTDIDGSRLNPVNKMMRATGVTRLMDRIPEATKKKVGFEFSGEYVVGVPNGTNAGYVVREVTPDYIPKVGGGVEPAFSTLSSKRLGEFMKDSSANEAQEFLRERLLRPMMRSISYLLMEEGMLGEYHAQNFAYVVDAKGLPTGKVSFHDADAFRTSVVLRTLNGRDNAPLRELETPFFFMKDGAFRKLGGGDEIGYNPNGLLQQYIADPKDLGTATASIFQWCKEIAAYRKTWCKDGATVRTMVLEVLGEELSPYVNRPVLAKELNVGSDSGGRVGILKLFEERINILTEKSPTLKPPVNAVLRERMLDKKTQKALFDEYKRLSGMGFTMSVNKNIDPKNTVFYMNVEGENAFIMAVAKEPGKKGPFRGMTLLSPHDDPKGLKFATKFEELTGLALPMGETAGNQNLLQKIGGGHNRYGAALPGVEVDCEFHFRKISKQNLKLAN